MEDNNAKIEDLKYRLERVVGWVNNCDQKAGILLAIEGVILTIICTSNNIQLIHNRLIKPIYEYWNNDTKSWLIPSLANGSSKSVYVIVKVISNGTVTNAVVGDVIEEKVLYLEYEDEKAVLFSQEKNPVLKMNG